jgi:hypothetical protein
MSSQHHEGRHHRGGGGRRNNNTNSGRGNPRTVRFQQRGSSTAKTGTSDPTQAYWNPTGVPPASTSTNSFKSALEILEMAKATQKPTLLASTQNKTTHLVSPGQGPDNTNNNSSSKNADPKTSTNDEEAPPPEKTSNEAEPDTEHTSEDTAGADDADKATHTPTKQSSNKNDDPYSPLELTPKTASKLDAEANKLLGNPKGNQDDRTPIDLSTKESDNTGPPDGKLPHDPFFVPDAKFRFNKKTSQQASKWALDRTGAKPFEEAIQTLTPQAQMKQKVTQFRNDMNRLTMAFTNATNNYHSVNKDKDFVHSCVRISPVYHIPTGAENYPKTFLPLYQQVESSLAACADRFRKEATAIIHKGHRASCLQLKLDRVRTMFHHLIVELGQYHSAMYRALHPDPLQASSHNCVSDITLATKAVKQLIGHFDLEFLEYLDMNRSNLTEIFDGEYNQITPKLSLNDSNTVTHVVTTILGYLKPATCLHYRKRLEENLRAAALANVAAKMEYASATAALQATEKALKTQADDLPKDNKSLRDVVTSVVDQRLKTHSQSHPKRRHHPSDTSQPKQETSTKKQKPNPKAAAVGKNPSHTGRQGPSPSNKNNKRKATTKDPTPTKRTATKKTPTSANASTLKATKTTSTTQKPRSKSSPSNTRPPTASKQTTASADAPPRSRTNPNRRKTYFKRSQHKR